MPPSSASALLWATCVWVFTAALISIPWMRITTQSVEREVRTQPAQLLSVWMRIVWSSGSTFRIRFSSRLPWR
eukprot:821062-Alexandrium_andersonii.AAC.1